MENTATIDLPESEVSAADIFQMRIMSAERGDLKVEWNRDNPGEVAGAREAFEKAKKKGMLFYKGKRDRKTGEMLKDGQEIIREFDPDAEMIIGMPLVVGG